MTAAARQVGKPGPKPKRRGPAPRVRPLVSVTDPWGMEVLAYESSLLAARRSPKTIEGYREGLDQFAAWMTETGRDLDPEAVTREDVEGFLIHLQRTGRAAGTQAIRFRVIRAFFNHLVKTGALDRSPLAGMPMPSVPEVPVGVLDEAAIAALLAAAGGTAFEDRRDLALLRVFLDTGLRLAEVSTIRLEDLDLGVGRIIVMGKGEKTRSVAFGQAARVALVRYLKARSRHRDAEAIFDLGREDRPRVGQPLWLGRRGPLQALAVRRVVERRAREAGVTGLHPHMFRHTWASSMKADGASDGDLMVMGGWSSREMLDRYGRATASDRALAGYRSPMDRRGL